MLLALPVVSIGSQLSPSPSVRPLGHTVGGHMNACMKGSAEKRASRALPSLWPSEPSSSVCLSVERFNTHSPPHFLLYRGTVFYRGSDFFTLPTPVPAFFFRTYEVNYAFHVKMA